MRFAHRLCGRLQFSTDPGRSGRAEARRGLKPASLLLVLPMVLAGAAWAQSPLQAPANPSGNYQRGFHLYSASAYVGYTSQPLPQQSFGFFSNPSPLGADQQLGGAVALGWNRHREETQFSMTYTGSYNALLRHSEWNSNDHFLSFSSQTRMSTRWQLSFSAAAGVRDFNNSLFTPTVFRQVAAIPTTFDDLAAAMLAGRFTNEQLASILTGTPLRPGDLVESPARLLLYGNRMFDTSLQSTVSYSRSTRLSAHFGIGAWRSQHLYSKQRDDALQNAYLIPRTTTAQATAGLAYSVTPRTQVGVDVSSGRTLSVYQDAYITNGTAFLGRTMGRHWFVQARGGAGMISPIRQTFTLPRGPQYLAGGTLGVKAGPHTLLASYDRSIGDSYGYGAGYSETTTGTWNWSRPGHKWTLFSSVSHQRLLGSGLGQLEARQAAAGAGRMLSRHTSIHTQYAYFQSVGGTAGLFQGLSLHGHMVRLSLVWTPGPEGFR